MVALCHAGGLPDRLSYADQHCALQRVKSQLIGALLTPPRPRACIHRRACSAAMHAPEHLPDQGLPGLSAQSPFALLESRGYNQLERPRFNCWHAAGCVSACGEGLACDVPVLSRLLPASDPHHRRLATSRSDAAAAKKPEDSSTPATCLHTGQIRPLHVSRFCNSGPKYGVQASLPPVCECRWHTRAAVHRGRASTSGSPSGLATQSKSGACATTLPHRSLD